MIRLDNVIKKFDDYIAIDVEDLQIKKGSIYGLVGSNGAGKSTLLRLVSGIYKPEFGRVLVEEQSVFENPFTKHKIFMVSDDPYFLSQSTLDLMAKFYKQYYHNFDDEVYKRLCGIFGLPVNKKISTFSKGMKRQAIFLLALSACPEYLLLDESFDGLDPVMRQLVRRVLIDIVAEKNLTVVISSHNLRELDELCDHIGIIHKGKLLFSSELESLKQGYQKIQLAFDHEVKKEDFADMEMMSFSGEGKFANIVVKGEYEDVIKKIERYSPLATQVVSMNLEEIFLKEMEVTGYDYTKILA
ncbi:MAG: transporter ATP-binding protein [Oscillospiraceae bacterium]|jgi:ABC-2 type transport system ATP-binding protein|nr:transporter ATP-binding protein [Oscillospiraceae bacterium]